MSAIEPGDRVRVADRWKTSLDTQEGIVKRVFVSDAGGTWATVRFNGQLDDATFAVRELELAPRLRPDASL